jgi:uncharacterized protein
LKEVYLNKLFILQGVKSLNIMRNMFDELLPLKPTDFGVRLIIKVTPKASSNRIGIAMNENYGTYALKVYVTAVPEDGEANEAVLKLLAKSWGLPKSIFKVLSGHKDRKKVIHIQGDPQSLMKYLRICI